MATITYPHIDIDSQGVASISGTTTKVIEIVQDHLAYDWDAEEICRQHSHLTLAQVYASLTYYYDHKQELDDDIERRRRKVADIKAQFADNKVQEKLRQLGYLP